MNHCINKETTAKFPNPHIAYIKAYNGIPPKMTFASSLENADPKGHGLLIFAVLSFLTQWRRYQGFRSGNTLTEDVVILDPTYLAGSQTLHLLRPCNIFTHSGAQWCFCWISPRTTKAAFPSADLNKSSIIIFFSDMSSYRNKSTIHYRYSEPWSQS